MKSARKILILILCAFSIIMSVGCEKEDSSEVKTISGSEWILSQDDVKNDYKEVIESTEKVYSLYIAGKMSSEDFYTELEILQKQLFYLQNNYMTKKSGVIIDPESSDVSKQGINALESLFTDTNKLYVASIDESGAPYSIIEMSYVYLNYKEKIMDDYINFISAVEVFENYEEDGTPKKQE